MSEALSAADLLPLLLKLPPGERLKLARLALRAALVTDDASAYRAFPPSEDEFCIGEDLLAWQPEDWSEFYQHSVRR